MPAEIAPTVEPPAGSRADLKALAQVLIDTLDAPPTRPPIEDDARLWSGCPVLLEGADQRPRPCGAAAAIGRGEGRAAGPEAFDVRA